MQYAKVHNSIWDNPKFQALPNDTAKLAFLRVLSAAKDSDPEGQWPDRRYLEAQLRGDKWAIPWIDDMLSTTLIVERPGGQVVVPQWDYWQKWEGKRPAAQLAVEAPAILEKRQKSDARRKRIEYWVGRGMDHIDACPEDIRDEVANRLLSVGVSAETHDHTDGRTNGRMSETETLTSPETVPSPVGHNASIDERCIVCRVILSPDAVSLIEGRPYCPEHAEDFYA